jgi:hypothetical protein
MEKIITEYINRTETLLFTYPNNTLLKSFLQKLKSVENIPDTHLGEFNDVLSLVYEDLKNTKKEARNIVIFKLFSAMVENVRVAVEAVK